VTSAILQKIAGSGMSIRQLQFALLWLGALAAVAINPTITQAQYTDTHCQRLYEQATQAAGEESFKKLIRLVRLRLTYCREWMTIDEYEDELEMLAMALREDDHLTEALTVANQCLQVNPNSLGCSYEKASSLYDLGRIHEAKKTLERALSLPAGKEYDVKIKPYIQRFLANVNNELRSTPAERPQQPQGVGRNRYGTGFYVTAAGHLVTNHHVAGACSNVQTSDGTSLKLIGSDKSADLALLQAIGKTPRVSASFRHTDAQIGEPIIVFGFPLPGILSTSGNLTTGAVSATSGIRNDPRRIQISAPIQPGNSGGPLLDQTGNIIGVVVTKLDAGKVAEALGDIPQNVNFAIKGSEVVAFLARHKITSNAGSAVRLPTEEVAAAALSFTVQIICHAE
jgi:S1-C subfamily serine protease